MMAFEIGAAIELGIGQLQEMNKGIAALQRTRPVRKPIAGSATVITGVNPTVIRATSRPASGRAWNILSAGIYGADPHTPVGPPQATPTGGFAADGSATAPAAGATIASVTLPPGVYNIYVNMLASGTLAAGDNNNVYLTNVTAGSAIVTPIEMDATTANAPTPSGPFQVQLSQQSVIRVLAIANATAGSIYTASLSAIPVTQGQFSTNVVADLYSGQIPEIGSAAMADLFDSAVPVPMTKDYSAEVYWAQPNDEVFALVYNASVGQQLALVANVAEYPIDTVMAMEIS